MSGGIEASQTEVDLKALVENFPVDNRDLKRLEALLDRFDIFEATGFIRQELRHSDFLAFLLDPKGNHGLGDAFAKSLLQRALLTAGNVPISVTPEELEQWDLNRMEVRREWQHIDILLLDEDHELAFIIENKIDTIEHSDQLRRYYEIVEQYYPGWRIIAVYLTRGDDPPSHEFYLPVAYDLVCEVIDSLAEGTGSGVSPSLKVCLEHYSDMLRRNIVVDSDVARLCRKIYQEHKRALDLIYEHRPDPRLKILQLLERLINDTDGLGPKGRGAGKLYLVFRPSEWEAPAALNAGSDSKGFIRFVFINRYDSLTLILQMTPGDEGIRRRLYEIGHKDEALFNNLVDPATSDYPTLYHRTFLTSRFYEEASDSDREEEIRKRWDVFIDKDLRRIEETLKEETWIWE